MLAMGGVGGGGGCCRRSSSVSILAFMACRAGPCTQGGSCRRDTRGGEDAGVCTLPLLLFLFGVPSACDYTGKTYNLPSDRRCSHEVPLHVRCSVQVLVVPQFHLRQRERISASSRFAIHVLKDYQDEARNPPKVETPSTSGPKSPTIPNTYVDPNLQVLNLRTSKPQQKAHCLKLRSSKTGSS